MQFGAAKKGVFVDRENISTPIIMESSTSTMKCRCQYCSTEFDDMDKYLCHLLKHKNLPNFEFKCPLCLISYTNYNSFRSHINRTHIKAPLLTELAIELKYICVICKFEINIKSEYKAHLLKHIKLGTTIKCNICLFIQMKVHSILTFIEITIKQILSPVML